MSLLNSYIDHIGRLIYNLDMKNVRSFFAYLMNDFEIVIKFSLMFIFCIFIVFFSLSFFFGNKSLWCHKNVVLQIILIKILKLFLFWGIN